MDQLKDRFINSNAFFNFKQSINKKADDEDEVLNFNLENEYHKIELPILEVSEKYYKDNKFMLIDPYKDISVPISEMV